MAGASSHNAFTRGILRTVRGSLKRFVALATITALGVTMLTGLRASCVDLRNSADAFFDEQQLFDIRVQSTLGLTEEDVDALAALNGVEKVEGGYVETAYTTVGSVSEKVDVKALSPSGMNEPLVMEGRLPQSADEIAVTQRYLKDSGLSIGDTVTFHGADDDAQDQDAEKDEGLDALDSESTEVFERGEYVIVGSVLDPMDVNAGEGTMSFRSSGGSQYSFFVTQECATAEAYTVVYLTVEGADEPLCYSAEYESVVDKVKQSVEDARAERERARGEGLRADATEEEDEAEAEALEELADAEQEIADGQAELDEGRAEVADGQAELDEERADALQQLDDAQAEIDEGRAQLEDGEAQLADGRAELEAGIREFNESLPGGRAAAEGRPVPARRRAGGVLRHGPSPTSRRSAPRWRRRWGAWRRPSPCWTEASRRWRTGSRRWPARLPQGGEALSAVAGQIRSSCEQVCAADASDAESAQAAVGVRSRAPWLRRRRC